eukprot:5868932-Prymnesium_polylepis.2
MSQKRVTTPYDASHATAHTVTPGWCAWFLRSSFRIARRFPVGGRLRTGFRLWRGKGGRHGM